MDHVNTLVRSANTHSPVSMFGAAAFLLALGIHQAASGAVTFFGSVNPDPPGDGNVESTLVVGLSGDDDPDLRGYVRIDGGTSIEYDALIVGNDAGYQGEVVISGFPTPGNQSTLVLEEAGSIAAPTLQIGHEGAGQLTIESGGRLLFENTAADLSIGVETTGVGTMTVTGVLSRITIPDSQRIGDAGFGRMDVLDGGYVHNSDTSGTAIIGDNATGVGVVWIDGPGSTWQIDDNLAVGSLGTATLTISNQGLVDVDNAGALTTVGNNGRIELDGGTLAATNITHGGYLGGSGVVFGAISTQAASSIEAPEGAQLRLAGSLTHAGRVDANAGEIEIVGIATLDPGSEVTASEGTVHFKQTVSNGGDVTAIDGHIRSDALFTNSGTGRIQGRDATLEFDGGLSNAGVLQLSFGTSDVFGDITNNGGVVVAGNSNATFYDDITNNAVVSVASGSTAVFFGDLTGNGADGTGSIQLEGNTGPGASPGVMSFGGDVSLGFFHQLDIELGGTTPGTGYDVLAAAGDLVLGGTLNVSLIDGFNPAAGDSFDILDWASVAGAFTTVSLPVLGGGLNWDSSNLLIDGTLSVADLALPGDLNGDGFVGIDDLNIVLGNWNQNVPPGNPLADPSGDGFVGIDDLNEVLGNWNAGTPPTSQGSIPEPGTAALIFGGVCLLSQARRRG